MSSSPPPKRVATAFTSHKPSYAPASASAPIKKTLALILRLHGEIRLKSKPDTIARSTAFAGSYGLKPFDYKTYANINKMTIVSLATLGNACHGIPNVQPFSSKIQNYYANKPTYNTSSIIAEVFSNTQHPDHEIDGYLKDIKHKNDFQTTELSGYCLDKLYTPVKEDKQPLKIQGSGIFYFYSDGFTEEEILEIRTALAKLQQWHKKKETDQYLFRGQLFTYIYEALSSMIKGKFEIDHLFLIDLSCDVYYDNDAKTLFKDTTGEITADLIKKNLKGGEQKCIKKHILKRTNKKKYGIKRKSKRKSYRKKQ